MGVNDFVFAMEIHGLSNAPDPTSTAPILLSTGLLPGLATAIPALSTYTVSPLLSPFDVSGYNWSSDPRRVVGSGGQCVVKLKDLAGLWGSKLVKTPKTQSWSLKDGSITAAATSIAINGTPGSLPTVNRIYWIEAEAVLVTVVTPTSATGATLTVTRARCGSRAVVHRLDPLNYYAGDDGSQDRMTLDSRPDFGSFIFTGVIYLFRLDQFGAVRDYIKRYVYLDGTPTPLKGRSWEIRLRDIGDLAAQLALGNKARQVTLSNRVFVSQFDFNGSAGFGEIPLMGYLYLTRLEAELLLREPVHNPGSGNPVASLVDALDDRMKAFPDAVEYDIEIEASGKWLGRLTNLEYREFNEGARKKYYVRAQWQIAANGRVPGVGVGSVSAGFADGWTRTEGDPVGRLRAGEQAPKVTLRPALHTTPVNAFLTLCCSDGAHAGGDTYDWLIGRAGAGLPSSWFNLGAVAGTIVSIDPGTTELLQRNRLLTQQFFFPLPQNQERKLGDFLAGDLCLPHALLLGPLQNGLLTLRPWARLRPAGTPVTLITRSDAEVEPGSRLPVVAALSLSSGFNNLTLAPEFVRSVRTRAAQKGGDVQAVRVWQPGNKITTSEIQSGSLTSLVSGFLNLYAGAPVVHEVPTSLQFLMDNDIEFLEFLTWSNIDVLSENGSGVTGVFYLLGYSIEWRTGRVMARVIYDSYNDNEVALVDGTGIKSPHMTTTKTIPKDATGLAHQVTVDIPGARGQDLATVLGATFAAAIIGAKVRVTALAQAASVGADVTKERPGHLEAYATVTAITFDAGSKEAKIDLAFDATWQRGTAEFISRNVLVPGQSVVQLVDQRPSATNVQAVDIEPPAAQLHNAGAGLNFIKVAGPKSFDRTVQTIKKV
jgi:hypothetical protein